MRTRQSKRPGRQKPLLKQRGKGTRAPTDPIIDAVCHKFQLRSRLGIKKNGTTLAKSPAQMRERIEHLQTELMDAVNYCEWILQRIGEINSANHTLHAEP